MKILKSYAESVDEDEDGAEDILKVQGISMACISGDVDDLDWNEEEDL